MFGIRPALTFIIVAAFAAAIAFASTASAQTMGEYGATVGNAAASAGAVPSAKLPDLSGSFHTSARSGGSSGSSQTIEIRGGSDQAARPRARAHDQDRNPGDTADDWVQVK